MLVFRLMEYLQEKYRGMCAMHEYARNGWISPWYHTLTWKERLFKRKIIDE